MKRISLNIRILTVVFGVLLAVIGCKRDPVVEEDITPGMNVSAFQPNVILLDTLVFSNPVRSNGQVRFDLIGTPPQIKSGDIILYPANGNLYGRVTSSAIVGSRMILQLETSGIDKVFKSISVQDENSKSLLKSRVRVQPDSWKSDTLNLSDFVIYDGFMATGTLQVKFKSGKLSATSIIDQFSFAAQGSEPWFDRLGLTFRYSLNLNGSVTIKTSNAMNARDSLLLEDAVYGPFLVNGFPVFYHVDTWMGYHVVTAGDTVLSMNIAGNTSGILSLKYNYWDDWKFIRTGTAKTADIVPVSGPRTASYSGGMFITQMVTPYFCGEPSLTVGNRFSADLKYDVSIPEWQASQTITEKGLMLRTGNVFGAEVPDKLLTAETVLFLESQDGVLENQSPKASFKVTPKVGFTDTNFQFDASLSSDLETPSDLLQYRWDFDADNHFDTEFNNARVTYYKYPIPGTYLPVLEVRDEGGLVSRITGSIDVSLSSSAPVAYFTVTPESGRVSDFFIFNGEGCYDSQDPSSMLKVRWDFNGDGVWETGWSLTKSVVYVFREPGKYVAKLEVLDTQGLSGSTTRIIDVAAANIKPTALFTVEPESGTIETRFFFNGSGSSDPEDAAADLQVRWDWENDGVFDTDYSTVKTIHHIFSLSGRYSVLMEVIDTEGYGSTYIKEVHVSDLNVPPSADFSVNPNPGLVDQIITFNASLSSDKEDSLDLLEVRWDWNNDNIYDTPWSTTKVYTKIYAEAGTYIIKIQVRDREGLTETRVQKLDIK
jgi:PKD repeat protein